MSAPRPLPASGAAQQSAIVGRSRSPAARVWARLRRHRGARLGGAILLFLIGAATLAPWLAPRDPAALGEDAFLTAPGGARPMGTDDLGRDVASRVVHGARLSLRVGLVAVTIAATAGTLVGLTAGYYGGRLDQIVMRAIDVILAFPGVLLALLVVAVLGRGLDNVMIAVGVANIPAFARLVRGSVLAARENVYVEASRALGCPDRVILFRHLLPAVFAPLLVFATLEVGNAVLVASSLSFLGLGAQPPSPEWGAMLAAGREYMQTAWWLTVFPGTAIALAVLAVNLLGDALRDALDPKLHR